MKNLINVRVRALILGSIAFVAIYTNANALSITNMSDIPYDLEMNVGGNEETVAIEPGRTWRTSSAAVSVSIGKRVMKLDPAYEYAIWKDGKLTVQRRTGLEQ